MIARAHNLKINGILLPFDATHGLTQDYEAIGGRGLLRLASGAAVLQQAWGPKHRTIIRGQGRYPDQLAGVDWSATLTIDCAAPLAIHSASTSVTLPAARRSDVPPVSKALVRGQLVSTTLSMAGHVGTLGTVTGASSYVTYYYPSLTCYAVTPPARRFDARQPLAGWELIAEEA